MRKEVERLLRAYEERAESESAIVEDLDSAELLARRDEFLLSVGRNVGRLLNLLVKESRSHSILDVGASFGYSAIWLAEAAECIGARVVSLEVCAAKLDYAKHKLAEVGLGSLVDFRLGDALDTLPSVPGPFDFVLLDVWKELYIPCLELIVPKLRPGALVLADNMHHPAETKPYTEAYQRYVRRSRRFDSVLLDIGSGIELSRHIG